MDKILNLPVTNKHLWEKHKWVTDRDKNMQHILIKKKYEAIVFYDEERFANNRTEHSNILNNDVEGVEIEWKDNPFDLIPIYDNFLIH